MIYKYLLLLSFALLSVVSSYSQAFQVQFESATADDLNILSLSAAPDGGFYALGEIANDSQNPNANTGDAVVLRTDEAGTVLWSQIYDSGTFQGITDIVAAPDGGFAIAGTSTTDYFNAYLARGNTEGTIVWSTLLGDIDLLERGFGLLATSDGGFLVTGHHTPDFNEDIYAVKLAPDGTVEWGRSYESGDDLQSTGYDVKEHPAGGYVIAGTVGDLFNGNAALLRIDESGSPVWMQAYDYQMQTNTAVALEVLPDGDILMLQQLALEGPLLSPAAAALTRLNPSGEEQWTQLLQLDNGPISTTINGLNFSIESGAKDMVLTPDDGVLLYLTNDLDNSGDIRPALVKLDLDGNLQWARELGEEGWLQFPIGIHNGLTVAADGYSALVYQNVLQPDRFNLAKLDPAGEELCLDPLFPEFQPASLTRNTLTPSPLAVDNQADSPVNTLPITFSQQLLDDEAFTLELGPDQTLCEGDTLTLAPDTTYLGTYTWNVGAETPSLSVSESGLYALSFTNTCDSLTDSVRVEFLPAPTLSDTAITRPTCGEANGSLSFTVTGGAEPYQYRWSAAGQTPQTLATPTVGNLSGGEYILSITDDVGCANAFTFNIAAEPAPVITADIIDPSCVSSTGGITLNVTGGEAPFDYSWAFDEQPLDDIGSSLNSIAPGFYSVTLTDANGCTATLEDLVVAPFDPWLIDLEVDGPVCAGAADGVLLVNVVSGGPAPYSFQLNGGTRQAEGVFENLEAGEYSVTVEDAGGCDTTLTAILPAAEAQNYNLSIAENPAGLGEQLQLSVLGASAGDSIVWSASPALPFSCQNCPAPEITAVQSATITATVTDEQGCTTVLRLPLTVNVERDVYLPNAFSPNDDGRNDTFQPYLGSDSAEVIQLQVFDRWGGLIYESAEADAAWDGTAAGEALNTGVYLYKVELLWVDGRTTQEAGTVHLIR